MKIKSVILRLVLIFGMLSLISCDSGSSSVSDYNPNLTGQQQKQLIISQVSSDAFEQILYDQLIADGLTPSAARSVTDCVQPEAIRLIQNTPAEQFNVSESEATKLGERLGLQAANICLARIS